MIDKKAVSIFNDVLGPVMTGPSSSHTAGPTRIGLMIRHLFGEEIREACICFDAKGSYPGTYKGQGSDKGFVGGLMGFAPDDEKVPNALEIARENGLKIHFSEGDLNATHPNAARITVRGIGQREMHALTHSTGGGTFEIVEIDGFPTQISGERYECVCIGEDLRERVVAIAKKHQIADETVQTAENKQNEMVRISGSLPMDPDMIHELEGIKNISVYWSPKVMPVTSFQDTQVPFRTAGQALEYAKMHKAESLAELAYAYEMARSGKSREEIEKEAEGIWTAMTESVERGLCSDFEMRGFLSPKAATMKRNLSSRTYSDLGILNKVMVYTTAVMEYNSAMGVVVAAPTAGSCGVLPAILSAMWEEDLYKKEEIIGSMMTAGLIGIFISHQATFAAEVCACQAENGSASSMAAAAVVQLLGGSIKEGFQAAGVALQNMLGLICDPVAGLVDIPCVNRNASAAANALVSANMVMAGFDPVIPLDEVIVTMKEVGKLLPSELRCTGKGGLCKTPTGMAIANRLSAIG